MKYENFKEVEQLVEKIDRLNSFLKSLEIIQNESIKTPNVATKVECSSYHVWIQSEYRDLTLSYIEEVIRRVQSEIGTLHTKLSKL